MRLLLIDGHYYAYRSFHAIRDLSNSRGEPTNAIFGFIKSVRLMLKHLAPDFAAVVWDDGVPKRRTELQPQYKQNRAEMPEPMRAQMDLLYEIVPKMGLHGLSLPDTEADDLIGSYAHAAAQRGMESILATNDKDLLALANAHVRIYSTAKADLASPDEPFALLDSAAVEKKWGVPPSRIHEVLALTGDSVDNIPGVPGVGPKTAAALVLEHGTIEAMLANPGAVKNEKLRAKIIAASDQIRQNREMVRLDDDLPLPKPIDALRVEPDYPALIADLEQCEFRGLLADYRAEAARAGEKKPAKPGTEQTEMFPF